jgi:hypothetical protein
MNKIISEGIDAATEVGDKIKESKHSKRGGGFPYKTALLTLGIGALIGYTLANSDASKKKK